MNSCEKIIEDVLTENYGQFYRLAYGYVRNEEDALDIVQESAYKAIKEAEKLKNPAFAKTWIYRIVINTAISVSYSSPGFGTLFPEVPLPHIYNSFPFLPSCSLYSGHFHLQLFQGTVETAFDGIGIFIHDHGDLLQLHIFKETKAYECFLFIRQSRKGFLQICISIGCVDSGNGQCHGKAADHRHAGKGDDLPDL